MPFQWPPVSTPVSTQKDTERAAVAKEEGLLKTDWDGEVSAVRAYYQEKGLSEKTAQSIAEDLMAKAPLKTIVRVKYDIELGHYSTRGRRLCLAICGCSRGDLTSNGDDFLAPAGFEVVRDNLSSDLIVCFDRLHFLEVGEWVG